MHKVVHVHAICAMPLENPSTQKAFSADAAVVPSIVYKLPALEVAQVSCLSCIRLTTRKLHDSCSRAFQLSSSQLHKLISSMLCLI